MYDISLPYISTFDSLVNKIVNEEEENRIIELLEAYNQYYIHLPVDYLEYSRTPLEYENFMLTPNKNYPNSSQAAPLTPDVLHSNTLR